ncbi:hypothetical protein ACFL6U_02925 [Planctomycetota bacterium]
MSTTLEQLLIDIDPARTYDQTFARADQAINMFSFNRSQITDWRDFNACLAEFFMHVEAMILQLHPGPLDVDFHWGRCVQLLHHIYGRSGEKAAFEMARTGNEGGLFSVLRAVALRMAEEYAENEISARVYDYWQRLSTNEQMSAATEYLEKYGHLLPTEMTEGYGARIRANFSRVLAQHPQILRKTYGLGR